MKVKTYSDIIITMSEKKSPDFAEVKIPPDSQKIHDGKSKVDAHAGFCVPGNRQLYNDSNKNCIEISIKNE